MNRPAKSPWRWSQTPSRQPASVGTAAAAAEIDGPSSSNWNEPPMFAIAVLVSPSPSVIVAVSVTRLAAEQTAAEAPGSSGSGRIVVDAQPAAGRASQRRRCQR